MEYVRCKSCGFIMETGTLGNVCPACGVPAKQFEHYVERISEKRLKFLQLDIHPIVVHMPQASAVFLVVLAILLLTPITDSLRTMLHNTTIVLAVVLPFTVLATFGAGLLDAKIRFHRVTTSRLKQKMLVGSSFFILSSGAAVLALSTGITTSFTLVAFLVLEALCLGCGAILGMWGSKLVNAAFPE